MSKILRAIRKHYPADYKVITKTFRHTPLMLREAVLYAVPYFKLETGDDSVFEMFGGAKLQGGFDLTFNTPHSHMTMNYRPDRVFCEYSIEASAEKNIDQSINGGLKGEYYVSFAMKDGVLEREVGGNVVSIDLCKRKKTEDK